MTNEEYKSILAQLSLSRRKWAKMIDATPRAVQNRADGTSGVSGMEAKFLRLLAMRPELVKIVEDME